MGEYLHKEYEKAENEANGVILEDCSQSSLFKFVPYGETHYLLQILGIKIKFIKPEFAKKKKENLFYYYKKKKIDITALPPATGKIRDIQLANLVLLRELDYVCKQAGLKYWLDGGTLLGAVRHKGFIPWDDDIDTSMLREDYDKIIESFATYSRNPDIYADYYRSKVNPANCYIRVLHKKCKFLFVDIFPWDQYGKVLTEKEQLEESSRIIKLRKSLENFCTKDRDNTFVLEVTKKIMREKVLNQTEMQKNADYVWGLDFSHPWKNWFTSREVLLPLKTIKFEGMEFPCMNNPDAFLKRVYGNYMDYPKSLTCGHSVYLEMTEDENRYLKEILGDKNG